MSKFNGVKGSEIRGEICSISGTFSEASIWKFVIRLDIDWKGMLSRLSFLPNDRYSSKLQHTEAVETPTLSLENWSGFKSKQGAKTTSSHFVVSGDVATLLLKVPVLSVG